MLPLRLRAAMVVAALSLAVFAMPDSRAAGSCPAGMTATDDGYCIAADQAYCGGGMACPGGTAWFGAQAKFGRCTPANQCQPNERATGPGGIGGCIPLDAVDCGGGTYCPRGLQCTPGGGCEGSRSAFGGEQCNGGFLPTGQRCVPELGLGYNPNHDKVCPATSFSPKPWFCNAVQECGSGQDGVMCLNPVRQIAATPQRSVPVTPRVAAPKGTPKNQLWLYDASAENCAAASASTKRSPAWANLCAGTPTVSAPSVTAPSPTVRTPQVNAPPGPTVRTPQVNAPMPSVHTPAVNAPTPRVHTPAVNAPAPSVQTPSVNP
jgi:hypothetical protein